MLRDAGLAYDVVWSPGFRTDGAHFADVDPAAYSRLVFVCGPAHGPQVEELHRRFAHCVRIAVGVSVVDPASPAVTGFHDVLARDAAGAAPTLDLAARAPALPARPVVGVVLTHGQHECRGQRRHEEVAAGLTRWLAGKDCAGWNWRRGSTRTTGGCAARRPSWRPYWPGWTWSSPTGCTSWSWRCRAGTPALAVDPVAGGAKVTAQARACGWPALVAAERLAEDVLEHWWDWCLTGGRDEARRIGAGFRAADAAADAPDGLVAALGAPGCGRPVSPQPTGHSGGRRSAPQEETS